MSIRGALSTMPAEDVLEWIARRKISGVVSFEHAGAIRSLGVGDASLQWSASNRSEEQLGNVLVLSGLISERALVDALEARAQTGVPLGKVLQMSGAVTEEVLTQSLATKIREAVTDVCIWKEGTFEVVPRTHVPSSGVQAKLAIDVCLTVARRRGAELTHALSIVGGDDSTFYVPSGATPPPVEDAIDVERVWTHVQAGMSVAQIASAMGGERYAVTRCLAVWVEQGGLVVDRRKKQRTESAMELADGARSRLSEGDRAGALSLATQALRRDPGDAEVRRIFARVERARVAELGRQLLARHTVPHLVTEPDAIDTLPLTQGERELARRVDGCWDLLSLIRLAPMREAEALLAFSRLAELGVVTLA
jgi:hypothetical protein